MMSLEKLYVKELKNKLSDKNSISIEDFYLFYKQIYADIKMSTVRWYIYTLKEEKIIKNISRGLYIFEDSIISNSEEFVVITIDIVDSSKEQHESFDRKLKRKVEKINTQLNEKLNYKRKFYISQGDEIQIFCPFDDRLSKLLIITLSVLNPYKARFSISIGNVEEKEFRENSWEMNGPIYWNARDKLTELKKSKGYDGIIVSEYDELNQVCNKFMKALLILINRVSPKQWDAIFQQQTNDDLSDILNKLDISKSSYYDRISGSNIDEILDALDGIFILLTKRRNF